MALTNRYVVLYWINGHVPTREQLADSREYGPHVMFRNANFHLSGDGMEPCVAVAGDVPPDYVARYPKAVPYLQWLNGKHPLPAAKLSVREMPEAEPAIKLNRGPLAERFISAEAPVARKPLPGLADAAGGWTLPTPPPMPGLPPAADSDDPPPPPPPPAS